MKDDALFNILMLCIVFGLLYRWAKGRKTYSDAHGSAFWMTDTLLKQWGMLVHGGLVVGKTLSGKLLYIRDFVHVLIIGGTGSGKSAGFVACNLIQYPGAAIAFDPKGELAEICPGITLASDNSAHKFNPLDAIKAGDIDACRQLGYGLIDTKEATHDAHWNESAVKVVTAVLCYVTKEYQA